MAPDWSSSKRLRNSGPFDPPHGLLGQGENSAALAALHVSLQAHSTIMCKNQQLLFPVSRDKKQTLNSRSSISKHVTVYAVPLRVNDPGLLCPVMLQSS